MIKEETKNISITKDFFKIEFSIYVILPSLFCQCASKQSVLSSFRTRYHCHLQHSIPSLSKDKINIDALISSCRADFVMKICILWEMI